MDIISDIAIIGAGPAGLSAANRAAELGQDVTVLEKQYEIGYPVRTSGGSYISDMEKFGIPSKYYNPIRRLVFGTLSNNAEFNYSKDTGCVLDTRAIYQWLAMEAVEKGCNLSVGTDVKELLTENGAVAGVNASRAGENIRVKSKVVIDCSGVSAISARKLGLIRSGRTRFGSGVEYEAYADGIDKSTAMLFVGEDIAPTGYVWVFPLSKNRCRIGIGITKPDTKTSPMKLLDKLINQRPGALADIGKISPIELHSGIIPVEPIPSRVVADGLIIAGDAAGQANPIVGEGIRPAMKFGRLAAEVSANAIERKNTRAAAFSAYEKEAKRVAGYNRMALILQRKMARYSNKDWDRTIEKLKKLSEKNFLTLLKADFSKRNMLGMLSVAPSFLLGGLKK